MGLKCFGCCKYLQTHLAFKLVRHDDDEIIKAKFEMTKEKRKKLSVALLCHQYPIIAKG